MPISPANSAISVAPQDLTRSALLESGIIAPEDKLTAQDAAWGLEKQQRLVDQWNARRELIFSVGFQNFNLQANHSPHTIGPGGDFNVPIRPVTIVGANFVLNGSSGIPIYKDINIRDDDWWQANPIPTLPSAIVTDLYYSADAPLGNLFFFPVCSIAAPVRLEIWGSLAQAVSQTAKLGFVQGYWEAIVLDLAVALCPSYNRTVSPDLRERWNRAMRIIEGNNNKPPTITTAGSGMPSSRASGKPDYNFLTGMRE